MKKVKEDLRDKNLLNLWNTNYFSIQYVIKSYIVCSECNKLNLIKFPSYTHQTPAVIFNVQTEKKNLFTHWTKQ